MTRLLHMSDIHFGEEDGPLVEAATAFALDQAPDLMVVSGDLTQYGREEQFQAAGAWLKRLPKPLMVTPGNHDTPWFGLWQRMTRPFGRYERWIGRAASERFDSPDLAAYALNSARGWQIRANWSKGEVSMSQGLAVERRFAEAPPSALRVVVCHHPLVEAAGGPMTGATRGGRGAARRIAGAGVDLVLSGHVHTPFVQPLPFGDGLTYAVGAGTLSLRLRGEAPGFNVIDVIGREAVVTSMVWTGHSLDAERTWAVPLRPRA